MSQLRLSREDVELIVAILRESLNMGIIDVAILNSPGSDENLAMWPLFKDEIVLVVNGDHHLAGRPFVEGKQLAEEIILVQTAPGIRNSSVVEFLDPARISPKNIQSIPFTDAVIQMVSAGLGVAPMAYWMIQPYLRTNNLHALRMGRSGIPQDWNLASLKNHPEKNEFSQIAKIFRRHLQNQLPLSSESARDRQKKREACVARAYEYRFY
jgi:LysR family transcriptional regulator, regulator for metE and metH